jgi:hypothetical protein
MSHEEMNPIFEIKIFDLIVESPLEDLLPRANSALANWIRMNIDPEVSYYRMQCPLLEMAFDKGIILGNEMNL